MNLLPRQPPQDSSSLGASRLHSHVHLIVSQDRAEVAAPTSHMLFYKGYHRFCHVFHFNHPFLGSSCRSLHLKITAKTYLCNIKYLYNYNIFISDPLSPLFATSTRQKIRHTYPAQYHDHLPKSSIARSLEILAHWSNVWIKNMRSVFSLWSNLSRRSPAILWWRVAVGRSRLKIATKHIDKPTHIRLVDIIMSWRDMKSRLPQTKAKFCRVLM